MSAAPNNRKFTTTKETAVKAAEIRDTFTIEAEVKREDGSTYTRTFVPSVLHIDEEGRQSVASKTEARPLTTEQNFFMGFERKEGENICLVNLPIRDLTVEEIEEKLEHTQYAARFKDHEKVSLIYIYRKTEDGWVFRRATDSIFITNEGNGNKRAKMAAHRSLAGGVFDTEKIDIKVDYSMHKPGVRCKRDGTMVGSHDLAMKLGGILLSQENRTNIRAAGNDGNPWHLKGDIIWSDKVKGGHDILTCPCNLKRDGGLMITDKVVIGTTGPQQQGKSVQSNAQFNAVAGHVLLDRPMYVNGELSVWEYQSAAKMGKTLSRVLLGKNPHFAGLDPEDQKLNRRADVAGYVERELGDSFISPAVTVSNIEAAEAMYGPDSKHRVPVPGAFSYSLTAPEILDDMCWEGPRPDAGEVAIYAFGFVPHAGIFWSIADIGGGADGDDKFEFFPGYAKEDFEWGNLEFVQYEFLSGVVRFPLGATIHEGKVAAEISLVRIKTDTAEFSEMLRRAHAFPTLDFHLLPESVATLPTPEVNEVPEMDEVLSFIEEVRRLAKLRGSYGRFSLRVTSLLYLATTFFNGELPPVKNDDDEEEKYTLPISMEAAIDSTAKTPSLKGMKIVEEAAGDMTDYIYRIITQHLDGKVDPLFAKRAGLTDSDGNLPEGMKETQWNMSVREEQWMTSYRRLSDFTKFLSERYLSTFNRAVGSLDGYEKNSTTHRFWEGVKQRRSEKKHESIIVDEMASSIAKAGLSDSDLQNLQRMQVMDIKGDRKNYLVSEVLFNLELVEQTVTAVDVDLHQEILTGVMDQVWMPLLRKAAGTYCGDFRVDPFIAQVVSGFDKYFGGDFDNIDKMIAKAEGDTEFLLSCRERAVNEAADLKDEYDDDGSIILCGADTTRGHPCQKRAATCPYH